MEKIEKIIKKKSYFNLYQSTYICFIAKEIIKDTIGSDVKILNFKNRILRVKMPNHYLVSEARIKKAKIIKQIDQKNGKKILKNIRFN